MLDFLFASGWGAFSVLLFFQLPFMLFFLFVVFRRGFVKTSPNNTSPERIKFLRNLWIGSVALLFIALNVASIKYMPVFSTAYASYSAGEVVDVDVTAVSWNYEISKREFTAGVPIRFTAKSADTVHGFAIYHPNGKILFTMMLVPGVGPSSLVYKFKDPGTYKVRCLEYCGAAHHEMSDELIVTARKS